MAEKKEKEEKKDAGGTSLSPSLGSFGCGCLVVILLVISFLLGTLYGRRALPFLFDQAHDGVDIVSGKAHEGIEKANEAIENSE